MESTGVYWKPIYAILEGAFEIVVANAQHVKKVPGHKTDVKDAEWIAEHTSGRATSSNVSSSVETQVAKNVGVFIT